MLADAGFPIGDPTQWRLNKKMAGGGSMMDIGIYALNAARYLTGRGAGRRCNAMMDTTPNDPRFREVEENISFQLRFPSGVLANCTSSYGAPLNRFRVVGTERLGGARAGAELRRSKMRAGTWTKIEERVQPVIDHFAAEMDHLSDCVTTDKPPLTPGEEGLKDMRIITADLPGRGRRRAPSSCNPHHFDEDCARLPAAGGRVRSSRRAWRYTQGPGRRQPV